MNPAANSFVLPNCETCGDGRQRPDCPPHNNLERILPTLTFAQAKDKVEGNGIVPFFIFSTAEVSTKAVPMTIETQVQAVEKMIEGILNDDPQYFLVEVKIRPTNNIKVFLDGDNGISIEKCISYNRQLYKMLEESGLVPPDDFSLEVSSPGLDEPLKLYRQYKKNVGRKVEVVQKDGVKIEGTLKEVSEQEIAVEEARSKKQNPVTGGKPAIPSKKKELIEHKILFESIKSTKIQIVF